MNEAPRSPDNEPQPHEVVDFLQGIMRIVKRQQAEITELKGRVAYLEVDLTRAEACAENHAANLESLFELYDRTANELNLLRSLGSVGWREFTQFTHEIAFFLPTDARRHVGKAIRGHKLNELAQSEVEL